jgi:CO/xanthine dehydrogenase Mo-binding subunit
MRLVADGSVVVQSGSTELGQGASTALAQIAAAELGVPFEKVRIVMSDTALVPYDRSTGASRTTTVMGLAIQRAAADIREQLLAWARDLYPPDTAGDAELVEEHGGIRIGAERYPWNRIVEGWFGTGAGEVIGRGYVRDDGVTKERPLFWEVALSAVDLSVDGETGEITVNELAAVADVGRAVNPLLMKGQDVGAAMMGLGVALRESLEYREGTLINGNLYEYRVPRTSDTPVVRSVHAERADGIGPYGIKGGGEGSLNPVAPAVANAIYRATGARIRTAPFTPERVWRAIRDLDTTENG